MEPSSRHFPVAKLLVEHPWYRRQINAKTVSYLLKTHSTISFTPLLPWMPDCPPEKCFTHLKTFAFEEAEAWLRVSMAVTISDAGFQSYPDIYVRAAICSWERQIFCHFLVSVWQCLSERILEMETPGQKSDEILTKDSSKIQRSSDVICLILLTCDHTI